MLTIAMPTYEHTHKKNSTFVDTGLCVLEENEGKILSPAAYLQ